MPTTKAPKNADFILAGTRTWVSLKRCDVDLPTWLQLKLSCSRKKAEAAAEWAVAELERLDEKNFREDQ